MTLFFYIVIGIITFIAFLHALAKKDYEISRTISINASREKIFQYVVNLENQKRWISWLKNDENLSLHYKISENSKALYWKNGKKIGEGLQKVIKQRRNEVFESRMVIIRPIKLVTFSFFGVKETDAEKSRVIFGFRGQLAFPFSILNLFFNFEKILRSEIETSLENLKQELESK
jgi:hypothetical protein